ncbi:MAG: nucleotidyltransferase domain-containing protein [Rhodoferax sp.]|nr:nucleotidyltransferase domain-containing protein [Rhodoferax sp.]
MRLNSAELDAIRALLRAVDPAGRIYLYGSRVDDARRGGDIDLFLEASRAIDLKTALTTQHLLTAACDTKVDLLVKSPGEGDLPIHQIARRGVQL